MKTKKNLLLKRLTKVADFISAIKPPKFDMSFYTNLKGQKKMNPLKCTSAGCVIGWFPSIFPSKFRWDYSSTDDTPRVQLKIHFVNDLLTDPLSDVVEFLDIPYSDADVLFGSGFEGYKTHKQVAKGIRRYIKTGVTPEPPGE